LKLYALFFTTGVAVLLQGVVLHPLLHQEEDVTHFPDKPATKDGESLAVCAAVRVTLFPLLELV
jgi:hypothetical protein